MSLNNNNYLDVYKPEYHIENVEKFKSSFYSAVYQNAFSCVEKIVEQNKKQDDFYEKDSRMLGRYANGKDDYNDEEICNIMTFVGERGTGKTSIMLSFMRALRCYNTYQMTVRGESVYPKSFEESNLLFTCLDCIDGSLLEHGENIFKLVLAQMYQKFVDLERKDDIYKAEDFDYRKKELLSDLEKIYKTVCDIEVMEKEQGLSGESYMSGLQSLSSSQKVRRDFKNLIEAFTLLMKYRNDNQSRRRTDHYVVITIDDIDLNIKNGFSMLEKLHRYCMVQNVIILLSVDMEQTMLIAKQNFYEVLPKVNKILRDREGYIQQLSMDYLDKVMPVNYRVYVPKITDNYSIRRVSIKKEKHDIKHSVLGKLYRRAGICFDSQGQKRHFYEPASMRKLTGFYLLLDSMKPIYVDQIYGNEELTEDEKQETAVSWENNCQILIADLSQRMVLEKLYDDEEAYNLFKTIEKEDIRRVKSRIIDFYQKQTGEEGRIQIKQGVDEEPSYGDLVEAIYTLGRIKGKKYKQLIHCLLAYLAYAFTRIYVYERLEIKAQKDNLLAPKGNFEALIGDGLVRLWMCDMMPLTKLHRSEDREIEESAGMKEDIPAVSLAYLPNIALTPALELKLKLPGELSPDEDQYIYVAKQIYQIELCILFLNNVKEDKKAKHILKLEELEFQIKDDAEGYLLKIEDAEGKVSFFGDYSILNIIMNSLYACNMLKEIERKLIKVFVDYYPWQRTGIENCDDEGKLKEALCAHSLMMEYENWEKKFGKASLPFPVYWFDFTYNVLKRIRKKQIEENPARIDMEDTYTYISVLYNNIGEQLKVQQAFYETGKEENNENQDKNTKSYPSNLYNIFVECPAIKYFLPGAAINKDQESKVQNEEQQEMEKQIQERKYFIYETTRKMQLFISKENLVGLNGNVDTREQNQPKTVINIGDALIQITKGIKVETGIKETQEGTEDK